MKRQKNTKSNLLAIAYFVLMLVVSTVAAHAQGDSLATSPLLRTTGPNVLGAGHLMWSGDINAYYLHNKAVETSTSNYTLTGANTGLRWGIGNRAELTLGFSVLHAAGTFLGDTIPAGNLTLTPSIGARLQLYEGKGWVPMVTFFSDLTLPIRKNQIVDSYSETLVEPVIGLQLRSRLGEHFYLDGSIGYAWNRHAPYARGIDEPLRYSLYLHWLTNERHMVSIGWENHLGHLESTWQVRDNFQLKAQLNIAAGVAQGGTGVFQIHGLVGFNWMLR